MASSPVPVPPVMHPNAINAAYWTFYNNGMGFIPQLGGSPISIEEWKRREMDRWNAECFAAAVMAEA